MSSVIISGDTSGAVTVAAPANAGTNTATLPAVTGTIIVLGTPQSMVQLNTANGYGSTNNKIRRFTNTVVNQGTDITYADSATLGGTFTINVSGVYAVSSFDSFTPANGVVGISLNSTQLTTSIVSITISDRLGMSIQPAANVGQTTSWTGYIASGGVIRAHTDGSAVGSSTSLFTITRVS